MVDARGGAETGRWGARSAVGRASGQSRPGSLGLHGLADARRMQNTPSLSASPRLCANQIFFFVPLEYSPFVLFAVLQPRTHAMIPTDRKSTRLNSSH